MITRIWQGQREYTERQYWVGQYLIQDGGRKHGMWEGISRKHHPSEIEAARELSDYVERSQSSLMPDNASGKPLSETKSD